MVLFAFVSVTVKCLTRHELERYTQEQEPVKPKKKLSYKEQELETLRAKVKAAGKITPGDVTNFKLLTGSSNPEDWV